MTFFDMKFDEAVHAFDIMPADLRALVFPGSGIGFWSLNGRVEGITSLDLEAELARLRERTDEVEEMEKDHGG